MSACRVYVGLSTRTADGLRAFDPDEVMRAIAAHLYAEGVPGCTCLLGRGWYMGAPEPVVVVFVSGISDTKLAWFLDWLCARFGQECVGVEPCAPLALHARRQESAVGSIPRLTVPPAA